MCVVCVCVFVCACVSGCSSWQGQDWGEEGNLFRVLRLYSSWIARLECGFCRSSTLAIVRLHTAMYRLRLWMSVNSAPPVRSSLVLLLLKLRCPDLYRARASPEGSQEARSHACPAVWTT